MLFVPRKPEKRSPGAIAVSVVAHMLFGAALLRAVVGSNGIAEWLIGPQGEITKEQIQMVAVRPPGGNVNAGGAPVKAPGAARTWAGSTVVARGARCFDGRRGFWPPARPAGLACACRKWVPGDIGLRGRLRCNDSAGIAASIGA